MAESLQDTTVKKTVSDPEQSGLSPRLRRRVASALEKHVNLHLPALPSRRITLASELAAKTTKRSGRTFVIEASLPIYSATLIQLARYGVASAVPLGMNVLVSSPEGDSLLVEVNDSNEAVRVISGPTVGALRKALSRKGPRLGTLQPSILRVAALHLYALWRSSGQRIETSVFIPYGANQAGVKPGKTYRFPHFQKVVQHIATQRILQWHERYEQEQSPPSAAKSIAPVSSSDRVERRQRRAVRR